MWRVVVWASGRGRAEDGMACAIREDGGDPCSVTGTRLHAMLAKRAHVQIEVVRHPNFRQTHIVESWASNVFCPQIVCFKPEGQFLTTVFGGTSYLLHFENVSEPENKSS